MPRQRETEERGVSLLLEDAVETGLFQGGECELSFEFIQRYEYKRKVGKGVVATVLLVTAKDENDEVHEEPYGVGSTPWNVSKNGGRLISQTNPGGLPKSCDTMLYMLGPLQKLLVEGKFGLPEGYGSDVTTLNGVVVGLRRMPVDRPADRIVKKGPDGKDYGPPTKLVVQSIISAPWAEGAKPQRAATVTKIGKKRAADDDDDDDEAPAPKKAAKTPVADEDLAELAIEEIIAALEDADDNIIKAKKLPGVLMKRLGKDHKDLGDIIEWCTDENLETEKGWVFDGTNLTLDK